MPASSDPGARSFIRSATADDVARIGQIARAAYAKYVERIGREPAPMVADFAEFISAGRAVVIETSHGVDGYMIAWAKPGAYHLDNIAVDPDRQGLGLGRCLIDHAITEASRLTLPAVELYTNAAMSENLALYGRMGFVETHRALDQGFHRVYMRLDLAARPSG